MKRFIRLDENDICNILMEHFDIRPSQITTIYTDKENEETEEVETKFFVEIEQDEG